MDGFENFEATSPVGRRRPGRVSGVIAAVGNSEPGLTSFKQQPLLLAVSHFPTLGADAERAPLLTTDSCCRTPNSNQIQMANCLRQPANTKLAYSQLHCPASNDLGYCDVT